MIKIFSLLGRIYAAIKMLKASREKKFTRVPTRFFNNKNYGLMQIRALYSVQLKSVMHFFLPGKTSSLWRKQVPGSKKEKTYLVLIKSDFKGFSFHLRKCKISWIPSAKPFENGNLKYLKVTIFHKKSFTKFVDYLINRIDKVVNILKCIVRYI